MSFLKKLKHKAELAVVCMKGAAVDWVSIKETSFKNFQDFEDIFCNKFWRGGARQ